jgi:hypothetical protein
VNFRDLVDADQMIKAAAEAGADACKFQAYLPFYESGKYDGTIHQRGKELNAIRLDESTIRYLYWRCQQHGIEFMCTPMYLEAVAMLDPYVKRWKVRYADRENESILGPCRATGKPMLVSGKNIFCISEYPPPVGFVGYDKPEYIGISHHVPKVNGISFDGFDFVEVHVRLDHYEPPHYCPIDTAVSITMSELAELCRRLKQ